MLCTFSLTGYAEKNKIKKYKKRKGVEIIMYTEDNFDRQTDRTDTVLFWYNFKNKTPCKKGCTLGAI